MGPQSPSSHSSRLQTENECHQRATVQHHSYFQNFLNYSKISCTHSQTIRTCIYQFHTRASSPWTCQGGWVDACLTIHTWCRYLKVHNTYMMDGFASATRMKRRCARSCSTRFTTAPRSTATTPAWDSGNLPYDGNCWNGAFISHYPLSTNHLLGRLQWRRKTTIDILLSSSRL